MAVTSFYCQRQVACLDRCPKVLRRDSEEQMAITCSITPLMPEPMSISPDAICFVWTLTRATIQQQHLSALTTSTLLK